MNKSIEERMNIVKDLIFNQPVQLMTSPLKEGSLKNKYIEGCCTGYTVQLDNLSYRGIWVSTLEDIKLKVDDEEVRQETMMLCLKGMKFPICDMVTHTEVFWGATDQCLLSVNKIGGLGKGKHKLDIEIYKRADFGHSYGEGEDGYDKATEFHSPQLYKDTAVFEID